MWIILLQKNELVIPDYQREYAWEEEHCAVLWEDLVDFYNNEHKGNDYFLGSVIFCRQDQKKALEIIDGQQRITTIVLLLKAFYDKLFDIGQKKTK